VLPVHLGQNTKIDEVWGTAFFMKLIHDAETLALEPRVPADSVAKVRITCVESST